MHTSPLLPLLLLLLLLSSLPSLTTPRNVTLSNVHLPLDTSQHPLLTGEISILPQPPLYYVYVNDWGGCAGIDCCGSSAGCASCCFSPPSPQYPDPCVYTANHTVVAYSTADFATFAPLGAVLSPSARRAGIEFRPQPLYNALTQTYLLWYEDRWSNGSNPGYAIASSPHPAGPFNTTHASVVLPGKGRVGDYDLFVDRDGTAYHVRTGLTIVQLDATYTKPTGAVYELDSPNVEGPAMFRRGRWYYLLVGEGCCACKGGSNVVVYTAERPLGPYVMRGDVGSNKTAGHVFDRHSALNYVTHAQQSKVVEVQGEGGEVQYLWLGNQWVTAATPGRERNQDLLYWAVLRFDETGNITQLEYQEKITLSVPDTTPALSTMTVDEE